ncbi:MBL fold metallo-hydrolase [Mucilaginibacter sp. UR6-11]|uniref:MBL fold metallo-hydrolase n=1 Tax=Mucilaginibacter sp. UR6-11 TaxID=1435644 RepID=UPI001E50085E|nr:MBL fold metallo-hydrolase [Mucilaginibacter sp. UR6-11]MCC8424227.1 MBL fold metallo-hydrolase [Mucilaginibacter sp. UR6-11]
MSIPASTKQDNKFLNPIPTSEVGFDKMLPLMKAYATNKAEVVPHKTLGPFTTDTSVYQSPPASGLRITWVGHSSLLIEIDGRTILTDPIWSQRASFTQLMGPRRFFNPPLKLSELPPLDAIIISHDHYDHLDKATIKFFAGTTIPFFCSLGVSQHLESCGIIKNFITELDWSDSIMIGHDCVITAAPARHFSGRGIIGRNETLWSSFVIKGKKHNIFFGADSGYFPGFKDIGETFGPFDLSILEIGAYGEYWPDIHMGPDKASNAQLDLNSKLMMPIHWGTFNLALHDWFEPIEQLQQHATDKNIALFVPEPGKPTEVTGAYNSGWWRKFKS